MIGGRLALQRQTAPCADPSRLAPAPNESKRFSAPPEKLGQNEIASRSLRSLGATAYFLSKLAPMFCMLFIASVMTFAHDVCSWNIAVAVFIHSELIFIMAAQ